MRLQQRVLAVAFAISRRGAANKGRPVPMHPSVLSGEQCQRPQSMPARCVRRGHNWSRRPRSSRAALRGRDAAEALAPVEESGRAAVTPISISAASFAERNRLTTARRFQRVLLTRSGPFCSYLCVGACGRGHVFATIAVHAGFAHEAHGQGCDFLVFIFNATCVFFLAEMSLNRGCNVVPYYKWLSKLRSGILCKAVRLP